MPLCTPPAIRRAATLFGTPELVWTPPSSFDSSGAFVEGTQFGPKRRSGSLKRSGLRRSRMAPNVEPSPMRKSSDVHADRVAQETRRPNTSDMLSLSAPDSLAYTRPDE